jgi:mono/diheme cytochrome c family protein
MNKLLHAALGSALLISAGTASADGMDLLKSDCSGCHDLTGPAPSTLQGLWERKGPDLFYAGNKYRREWLESWLQEPTQIRPAGVFYARHVVTSDEGDQVDESGLIDHPALSAEDAEAVAEALMTLRAGDELVKPGEYKEGSIGLSMGEMMFDKFRGCLACHQIEPGYGGLSGPEVYTAARRLQPDWMISYMRNPQAWDPRSFMPNRHLTDSDLQKLVHYMRALAEEVE